MSFKFDESMLVIYTYTDFVAPTYEEFVVWKDAASKKESIPGYCDNWTHADFVSEAEVDYMCKNGLMRTEDWNRMQNQQEDDAPRF